MNFMGIMDFELEFFWILTMEYQKFKKWRVPTSTVPACVPHFWDFWSYSTVKFQKNLDSMSIISMYKVYDQTSWTWLTVPLRYEIRKEERGRLIEKIKFKYYVRYFRIHFFAPKIHPVMNQLCIISSTYKGTYRRKW